MRHIKLFEDFTPDHEGEHAPETSYSSRLASITKDDIKKEYDKIKKDPKISFDVFLKEVEGIIEYKKSHLSDIDPITSDDLSASFYDSVGDEFDEVLGAINNIVN